MAKMKRAYSHPVKGYVMVKEGFSWPAFFFGSLWAAAKKMWVPYFLAMVLLDVILWFLTGYAQAQQAGVLALLGLALTGIYAFFRGWFGNRFLAKSLLSRGFEDKGPAKNRG